MAVPAVNSPRRGGGFTFKQFFVAHDRCAMKVGTDGVLLGAWAPLDSPGRVLDIGTGCGLIALMMAQRVAGGLPIDAVELDVDACRQAGENFAASPWSISLMAIAADILAYARQSSQRYDLIVSNPPYFPVGPSCATAERDRARYTASLGHAALLAAAAALSTDDGTLALVLPKDVGDELITLARGQQWFLRRRTEVTDRPGRPPNRVLLAFRRQPGSAMRDALLLRDGAGQWSPAFRALARDFYLAM